MIVAVLSGKGGTGKTLVSVNLASISEESTYIDCDVEEPNGHLFFKPKAVVSEDVLVKYPEADNALCNGCRKCVDFCKFNAIAYIKDKLLIFKEICHSCGGCMIVCPKNALREEDRKIGEIKRGLSGQINVNIGILNPGEASGVPIINGLLKDVKNYRGNIFIDCPPGSACTVMESIKDADYCLLVAEPTLFGVHNLEMVFNLVNLFKKPHGVLINKWINDDNPVTEFCKEKGIMILEKIPFDNNLGKINSNGKIAVKEGNYYKKIFSSILEKLYEEVQDERTINP